MRKRKAFLLSLVGIVGSCSVLEKTPYCVLQNEWYTEEEVIASIHDTIEQRRHYRGDLSAYVRENPDCCRLEVWPKWNKIGFRYYEYKALIPIDNEFVTRREGRRLEAIEQGTGAYAITHKADKCLRSDTFGLPVLEESVYNYWKYR